jgi:amidase
MKLKFFASALGVLALHGIAVAAPFKVEEASIADIQHAILKKQVTCAQVVDQYLARTAAYDQQGPALNAVITMNQDARKVAARLDAQFKKTGKLAGPLHCVPVAVKDNYNTTDLPTSGGNILLKDSKPKTESAVTARIRDAGGIILMKTNLHEFALSGTTMSSRAGQTKNPYDLTRTPGGSSGGTGAAVASSFAAVGLGSDTVNSIRSPASANSLVGFRTSKGLVSRAGVMPVSSTQDIVGPLGRTVADVAVVLDVISGYDPADAVTAAAYGRPAPKFAASLDRNALKGARIGVVKALQGTQPIHQEVNAAMVNAVAAMKKAGATIVEIDDPALDADAIGRDMDVQKYEFKPLFNEYLKSLGEGAPVADVHALIASGQYHQPSLAKFLASSDAFASGLTEPDYLARLAKIDALRTHLLATMAEKKVDFLVYPMQKRLVVPITELNQADRNGIVAGVTGFPAIDVPMGFSAPSDVAPLGVPMGMDILGRPFDDARVLKIAYAFEQATHARKTPRSTPALK